MDLIHFNRWMIDEFDFNCSENEIFLKAFREAELFYNGTFINGIPAEEYHGDKALLKFLSVYLVSLQHQLKQILPPDTDAVIEQDRVVLNDYSHLKEELQSKLSLLMSQCED